MQQPIRSLLGRQCLRWAGGSVPWLLAQRRRASCLGGGRCHGVSDIRVVTARQKPTHRAILGMAGKIYSGDKVLPALREFRKSRKKRLEPRDFAVTFS